MSLCCGSLLKDGLIIKLWLGGYHVSFIISIATSLQEGHFLLSMKLDSPASVIWLVLHSFICFCLFYAKNLTPFYMLATCPKLSLMMSDINL